MAVTTPAPCLTYTFCPTDDELVAILPRLHAGEVIPFVHRADVYSAAPADLVGNLVPAPGTDKGDGNGGVWYFWCPKKEKSGGRRPRTIDAGNGCYWRGEAGRKKVESLVVGYFSTFSYGYNNYKTPAAKRQFKRLGWCMVEYIVDDPRYESYDHVLCKVYPSPRAKASSSNSAVLPDSKRKAAGGDHPEAPPARLSPQLVQENRLIQDVPMMPVQVQHGEGLQLGYVHEGPQPGAGAVHGGEIGGLIGAGISMEEEQPGIDYEELLRQLSDLPSQADYDPLPWPASPDYPFLDDHLFEPN